MQTICCKTSLLDFFRRLTERNPAFDSTIYITSERNVVFDIPTADTNAVSVVFPLPKAEVVNSDN